MMSFFGRKAAVDAERAYPAGQISVTDPEVRKRLDFLQVTPGDLGVIQSWESVCKAACAPMIDDVYRHISRTRETQAVAANAEENSSAASGHRHIRYAS